MSDPDDYGESDRDRLGRAEAIAQEMGGRVGFWTTREMADDERLEAVIVRTIQGDGLITFVIDGFEEGERCRVLLRRLDFEWVVGNPVEDGDGARPPGGPR